MGLRQGVTAAEENKIKHLVSQGKTWEEIVALCQPSDEKNFRTPLLDGVDLKAVKKAIFDPFVKKLAEAKKAGHDTIHAFEAHQKKVAKELDDADDKKSKK